MYKQIQTCVSGYKWAQRVQGGMKDTGRHKHVHRVSTSCFNHLAKIRQVLKVESQSVKN